PKEGLDVERLLGPRQQLGRDAITGGWFEWVGRVWLHGICSGERGATDGIVPAQASECTSAAERPRSAAGAAKTAGGHEKPAGGPGVLQLLVRRDHPSYPAPACSLPTLTRSGDPARSLRERDPREGPLGRRVSCGPNRRTGRPEPPRWSPRGTTPRPRTAL